LWLSPNRLGVTLPRENNAPAKKDAGKSQKRRARTDETGKERPIGGCNAVPALNLHESYMRC